MQLRKPGGAFKGDETNFRSYSAQVGELFCELVFSHMISSGEDQQARQLLAKSSSSAINTTTSSPLHAGLCWAGPERLGSRQQLQHRTWAIL